MTAMSKNSEDLVFEATVIEAIGLVDGIERLAKQFLVRLQVAVIGFLGGYVTYAYWRSRR